jgi:pimeloyl-ACP methyl ester carboxylesterase
MLVESPGHDLIGGGLQDECELASDATAILEALDHSGLEDTDILAWCDGGRLAIELARRRPRQIGALVLLSVSLRGTKALNPPATPYEANFSKVMSTIAERPALAPMFAKMLGEQILSTDWDGFADDVEGRVAALCRLPAQAHEPLIRVPLSTERFLLNHGKRIRSDAGFAVDDAIRALDLPLLMITGDRDHIANGAVARGALGKAARRGIHARITGAGHYSFDLQYAYFRLLLTEFLMNGKRPKAMARIEVEEM